MKEKLQLFRMKEFAQKKYIYLIYIFIFICLFLGLISDSGFQYVHFLLIYFVAFCVFSILLTSLTIRLLKKIKTSVIFNDVVLDKLAFASFVFIIIFIAFHYFVMQQIPLVEAWKTTDDVEIAKIRNLITIITPLVFNYISSFVIKGMLPFFIYYFHRTEQKKLFWILSFAGAFYTLSLIQKSYIVIVFMPLWIYFLVSKKYLRFTFLTTFYLLAISFLVITSNPFLIGRGIHNNSEDIAQEDPFASKQLIQKTDNKEPENVFYTIYYIGTGVADRMFLTPGKIVSKWFQYIPSQYPYAKGCAYHFAAPFLACNYIDYSSILYDELYPNYAAKGLHGSVVVTSFMYDFANFGVYGLILSAFILSILFVFVNHIFSDNWKTGLPLNFYFIIILLSSAISTLLFSGGWGLIILLYLIFKNRLKSADLQ